MFISLNFAFVLISRQRQNKNLLITKILNFKQNVIGSLKPVFKNSLKYKAISKNENLKSAL